MKRTARVAQLLAVNAVPLYAVVFRGWSDPTALALYWCETVMLVVLVTIRLEVHRQLTWKRGHFVETRNEGKHKRWKKRGVGLFATNFFWLSIGFSGFNALFLGWAIGKEKLERIDAGQLRFGVVISAILLLLGLVIDLFGMRQRPFAWIRAMSVSVLSRVFLVQFALILGAIGARALDMSRSTLLAFVFLKILTDIRSQIPSLDPPLSEKDRERAEAEEQRFTGKPIPFEQALIQRTDG